jgi:hypothetical protein
MAFVSKVDVVAAVRGLEIDEVAQAAAVRKIRKMPAVEINVLGDLARAGTYDSEAGVADKDSVPSCAGVVAAMLVNTEFRATSQESPAVVVPEPEAAPVEEPVEEPVAEGSPEVPVTGDESGTPVPTGRRAQRRSRQAAVAEAG